MTPDYQTDELLLNESAPGMVPEAGVIRAGQDRGIVSPRWGREATTWGRDQGTAAAVGVETGHPGSSEGGAGW